MKAASSWALVTGMLLGAGLAASCTLTDDDPPDRSCRGDDECFVAQGERCNVTINRCEVMPDAGTALQETVDERRAAGDAP